MNTNKQTRRFPLPTHIEDIMQDLGFSEEAKELVGIEQFKEPWRSLEKWRLIYKEIMEDDGGVSCDHD